MSYFFYRPTKWKLGWLFFSVGDCIIMYRGCGVHNIWMAMLVEMRHANKPGLHWCVITDTIHYYNIYCTKMKLYLSLRKMTMLDSWHVTALEPWIITWHWKQWTLDSFVFTHRTKYHVLDNMLHDINHVIADSHVLVHLAHHDVSQKHNPDILSSFAGVFQLWFVFACT